MLRAAMRSHRHRHLSRKQYGIVLPAAQLRKGIRLHANADPDDFNYCAQRTFLILTQEDARNRRAFMKLIRKLHLNFDAREICVPKTSYRKGT